MYAPEACHGQDEEMHCILGATLISCLGMDPEMQTGPHSADILLLSTEDKNEDKDEGGVSALLDRVEGCKRASRSCIS